MIFTKSLVLEIVSCWDCKCDELLVTVLSKEKEFQFFFLGRTTANTASVAEKKGFPVSKFLGVGY